MEKQLETVYVPVNVKDRLPEDEEYKVVFRYNNPFDSSADYNPFDTKATHWLEARQAILLTKEEWEGMQQCIAALEDIANPMKKIQEDAEKEGAIVNGAMAIQLCKDGNWLSEKAKRILPTSQTRNRKTLNTMETKTLITGNEPVQATPIAGGDNSVVSALNAAGIKNYNQGETLYQKSLREFMCAIVTTLSANTTINESVASDIADEAHNLTTAYINQLNKQ